ncbi:MAG: thiolase family protein [Nitrospirae bacterium]|nr:thiolase family protein [Nitrospirota bacterium]
MRDVAVIGVGMTHFGKFPERSLKDLAREAVEGALKHASVDRTLLQAAYVGNAMAGLMTGQECIRGQVLLRPLGIEAIPIVNAENACASASTAFHLGWLGVAAGLYDVVLALGVEKLYDEDKKKSFRALGSAVDVEFMTQIAAALKEAQGDKPSAGSGSSRSVFMDFYAMMGRLHMERFGTKKEHFAKIAVKNHYHGSLNPHAQYRETTTLEEVMAAPLVVEPLTRPMTSPLGDGAAAAVLCDAATARRLGARPVWVKASVLVSGKDRAFGEPDIVERAAKKAYESSGVGPGDLNVVEVHDATSAAELLAYEELGLCREGEGGRLVDECATTLGGRVPVNTSGGLCAKGHPVGATGIAQIAEIVWQLRGEAGERQVERARFGLTQNGGGALGNEAAAMAVHILAR